LTQLCPMQVAAFDVQEAHVPQSLQDGDRRGSRPEERPCR
jgi:hypothetical protein